MNRKVVLVTGASRGIGRATALKAAAQGWAVVVNYLHNHAAADEVVAQVRSAGSAAIAVQGDVAVEADVLHMFAQADALGSLAGAVINAGIVAPPLMLVDMPLERLQRMFNVNVLGAYLCAREAARRMMKSGGGEGGSLVLVSSMAAVLGSPGEYVDYAGSKGAVDTLVTGLAKEMGPEGVRVNAVRPGLIDTEIHASGGQPGRAWKRGVNSPLGRPGTAEEVAEAILWLLSDAASYTTGTHLEVSGGLR
ncbi:SDR family oxidoreductase [Pseudomonas sp. RIT-PI-S]|uniref:SDR family oxidoreductase n=1 Tax=Pseudomonas sp. RIT-PI-S TaxID=3035295 RepID=UPI0021DA0F12|nr:SDR family oxidoreductase [Pseudomonas sp. RIT-PI-S]